MLAIIITVGLSIPKGPLELPQGIEGMHCQSREGARTWPSLLSSIALTLLPGPPIAFSIGSGPASEPKQCPPQGTEQGRERWGNPSRGWGQWDKGRKPAHFTAPAFHTLSLDPQNSHVSWISLSLSHPPFLSRLSSGCAHSLWAINSPRPNLFRDKSCIWRDGQFFVFSLISCLYYTKGTADLWRTRAGILNIMYTPLQSQLTD